MDVELTPEPDESTRRAVAVALARLSVGGRATGPYASPWRVAGLTEAAEPVQLVGEGDEAYGCSPRSIRGVTRA